MYLLNINKFSIWFLNYTQKRNTNCCNFATGIFAHSCHTVSLGDKSGLLAGHSRTHTLFLQSHTVAEWSLALSCWNNHGLPRTSCHLDGSMLHVSLKSQYMPPHQWNFHTYVSHPCSGHACTPYHDRYCLLHLLAITIWMVHFTFFF